MGLRENKKEKLATFKRNVIRQIAKEEKKASIEDIELWYSNTRDDEKLTNEYCRNRQRLLDSIRDERLDPIIMAIKLDYDRIDKNFVETGSTARNEKLREQKDTTTAKDCRKLTSSFVYDWGSGFL
jgi:hypothetical protein